jgi:hypothetical protein
MPFPKSPRRREIAGLKLMTLRTSAVAVCCSKASRVSVISRVFDRDDCLIGEGLDEFDLSLCERFDVLSK